MSYSFSGPFQRPTQDYEESDSAPVNPKFRPSLTHVYPKSKLLMGNSINSFETLDEAERAITPEILAQATRVSGRVISDDIRGAAAVGSPAEVLESLPQTPDVADGKIVAGPPSKLELLNEI